MHRDKTRPVDAGGSGNGAVLEGHHNRKVFTLCDLAAERDLVVFANRPFPFFADGTACRGIPFRA
jgi:hypothetical protein